MSRAIEWERVWIGSDIATMCESGASYGMRRDAALAVANGCIAWLGAASEARREAQRAGVPVEDCSGLWMLPGLIDCHTHLVYGGDRVGEFEQRLCGASYEDIARGGGGIQSTVDATRAADAETLLADAMRRARRLMAEGVTAIEIKSGYGLDLASERRMLQVARELGRRLSIDVHTTYLGLHALPPEYKDARERFVELASGEWLEALHAEGLVDGVDVFCERIAFTRDESARFLRAARALDIPLHIHAGQLSDLGAAELAAELRALSADHLEFLSEAGAAALASAGTVAVLSPGAYYTLKQTTPPPIALLRREGVAMAVATDCNPGSSPCTSLLLALNMACTLFNLTPEEALRGATWNAARALGIGDRAGTLEVGKRADFGLYAISQPAELCYAIGANPCVGVVNGGRARVL